MKKALPSLRQVKILGITLLGLLVPFSVYYLLYSANQKEYFVRRDFRLLSVLGSGIEKKVDGIGNAYTGAAKSAARRFYLKPSASDDEVQKILKSQSLELDKMAFDPQGQEQLEPSLDVRQESGIQWLFFRFTEKEKGQPAVAVSAKTKLEDFVAPFFSRLGNGEDFDSVFLADVNGQLLYQWAPDEVHLTNFSALLGKNGAKVDFDQLKQNSNVIDVTIAETDYKLFLQPVELSFGKTNDQSNHKLKWAVGGLVRTSHLMSESRAISYTLLMRITFLFILIVLCFPFLKVVFMGPKDVLKMADVYLLGFATLVGSAWLTAFLMFTVAYKDLEKKMDGQLEELSAQLVDNFQDELGLAIQQLDELNKNPILTSELKQLANSRKPGRRDAPTDSSAGSTDRLHANVQTRGSQAVEGHDLGESQSRIRSESQTNPDVIDQCPPGTKCAGLTNVLNELGLADGPYPYFTTAFWTDKSGQQRVKWTTRSVLPSYVSIRDRSYFTNVLADRTWTYKNQPLNKFFLEPVYSKATGNLQLVLSKPMPNFKDWVSSMDIGAISLVHTVLPDLLGYGYCVIDDEGKVLFHSDESRNLVENLFRESDNDTTLRAAVLARDRKPMNVQYQGRSYRIYTRPLNNTPWTLITFRDERLARSAALEFVAYAVCFFCIYASVLLIAFSFYYVLNREDRSALLWPHEKHKANYYLSVAVNLSLGLIFLLGLACGRRWLVIALILILPATGLVFHHYNVRGSKDLGKLRLAASGFLVRRFRIDYRKSYVLTLVSLLMLVSVLPMIAFFTFAYDREMKRVVELGQINLATGIQNRALLVRSQLDALVPDGLQEAQRDALLAKRLNLNRNENGSQGKYDVYDHFFFSSETVAGEGKLGASRPATGCSEAFLQWRNNANLREECVGSFFDLAVPFQTSVGLPELGVSRPSGNNDTVGLVRREANKDRLVLHTEGTVDGNKSHPSFLVSSQSPTLTNGWSMPWRIGVLLILLLVAWLLFAGLSFIGRRLFLLASDEPTRDYGNELNEDALSQNLFLIASRFTRNGKAPDWRGFQVIDLWSIKSARDWAQFYGDKYANGNGKHGIAIDHFEYRLDDPDTNARKIKLIEHFLAHNRTLIVASTVDMANYALKKTSEKEPEQNGNEDDHSDARMPAALASLRRFCLEDRGNQEGFNLRITMFREKAKLSLAGQKKRMRRIDRLLKAVKRECQSRAYLQVLGERLLERNFMNLNPDEISAWVQDRCDAYYRALWNTCSSEEKMTLVHLATNHLVSSYNPSLTGLLRRGLIFKEPFLRPMNLSFTRFVAAQATPENVQDWKGASQSSLWEVLRVPLLIGLVVVAGFLFVSQRDLYNSTLAFVSAFAAFMPVIFKFLGMFPGGRVGAVS